MHHRGLETVPIGNWIRNVSQFKPEEIHLQDLTFLSMFSENPKIKG